MSHQAVTWAWDESPMLRTEKGLPDTTARAVLAARAERADELGRDTHAGIEEIIWRTGYDERTIQRAEQRLEAAGLMVPDGVTRWGTPRWNLDMSRRRDPAERDEIAAAIQKRKGANAARERARRARQREQRADSPSTRVDVKSTRADSPSTRADSDSTRVDAAPPEPPMNHPGTSQEPPEPPTGGAPPPDPRRPPPPPASGIYPDGSRQDAQDQAQDQQGESLPRETSPALHLVAGAADPEPAPPRGLFPIAVPGRRQTRVEAEIAAATARRAAARAAHKARGQTG